MKTFAAGKVLGRTVVLCVLVIGACQRSSTPDTINGRAAGDGEIRVLSNRADLISGGDALVEIMTTAPTGGVQVEVNGRDVSAQFGRRPNGRYMGLVTGLAVGANTLTATGGGVSSSIVITNYPNGGPIFSGPQIQPWPCNADAIDSQCNTPVTYAYEYKSSASGQFGSYDPDNPPSDVATTTTDQGNTVPYIIRIETGAQDRGVYKIAVLFDPSKGWQPWAPQSGWNGKAYMIGGSGCGTHHGQAPAAGLGAYPDVVNDNALSRGFAVFMTSLDHNTLNCNLVVQAEAMMMLKERLIEAYGPLRYTIGSGCSGGSIYQQQAANDYPGIFDGILPNCSFPDSWTTAIEVTDCLFMVDYFDHPDRWGAGIAWADAQKAAVEGHPGPNICESWINVYAFHTGGDPRINTGTLNTQACNVPAAQPNDPNTAYDPDINPRGARCDLATYFANELGLRPRAAWSPQEVAAGHGFAQAPFDNTGVQYGLKALLDGTITPAQFIDLNQKLEGRDIDFNPVPNRVAADPGTLAVTYRGGLYNQGNNMHGPIIDLRGHDVEEIHHDYRSYVMRARLDRANGHHDNQVIWVGPAALVGDAAFAKDALTVMDQWLAAIEKDTSDLPYARKVVKNKPAEAHDLCTDGNGNEIGSDSATCATIYPYYAEPRMVAGEPFTGDTLKCQLKALNRADYTQAIALTDADWEQLQQIFPKGVCDYTLPGLGQQPTVPWMTYANGPGGQPLPPAPVSQKF